MPPAQRGCRSECLCDQFADKMSEFLDGELEAEAAWAVAVHLSRCPTCARLAEDLAATVSALHRLGARSRLTPG